MTSIQRAVLLLVASLPIVCVIGSGAASAADAARVEIAGRAAVDDGRDSTASRIVVSREEIARFGDSSITDVLRRVPGITITGGQGRASDVRMRGLGSGYTQILVNGEAVPAGFSLESLPPGQIERIEIARVATVDVSAQAIAGTINIILRQSPRKGQREVKAGASSRAGRGSATLDGQFSDRLEGLSYSLGAGLSRKNDAWPSTITQQGSDASGTSTLDRLTRRRAFGLAESVSLTPKLSPQMEGGDRFSIEALLRHNRFKDHSDDQRLALLGGLPRYPADNLALDLRTSLLQTRLNWTHTLAGGASIDTRLGLNRLRRASDSLFLGQDEQQLLVMDERVRSSTTERAVTGAGKLRLPYTEGHALALGWDAEHTRRDESRSQRQLSPVGRPVVDLDEQHQTRLQRLALYAQDEWDWGDSLSAYAGLRWATLRTRTEGLDVAPVGNRSAVLSPVLQVLWKPAQAAGDQMRLALSRSYKAPRAVDLIPRRFVSIDNTPTTPNLQGNPDLRPELAWGIDLAYEHVLARKAGSVNLNLSARRIRDVILERLSFEQGAWVSTHANQGQARVLSVELESRLRLRAAWPGAPDVDLRAGAARNWSTVDQVPGPDNRLDSQVPLSATLGADWRVSDLPLTLGASLAWRAGLLARTSLTQSTASNGQKTLDLYGLWQLSPSAQLRAAVNNALRPHELGSETYFDANGAFRQVTDTPSALGVSIGLELKL